MLTLLLEMFSIVLLFGLVPTEARITLVGALGHLKRGGHCQ
jgi:hypothetical protein